MKRVPVTSNFHKNVPAGEERKGLPATAKNVGVGARGTIAKQQEGPSAALTAAVTVPGRISCATDFATTATATKERSAVTNADSHEGRVPKGARDGNGETPTDEHPEVSIWTPPNPGAKAEAKGPIDGNNSCMKDNTKKEEPPVLVTANPSWVSPDLQPRYGALLCNSVWAIDKHCAIVAMLESTLASLETMLSAWE